MIPENPRKNSAFLPVTVKPSTLQALNEEAKKTGNRSFIVEKAILQYLGIDEETQPEEKKAS